MIFPKCTHLNILKEKKLLDLTENTFETCNFMLFNNGLLKFFSVLNHYYLSHTFSNENNKCHVVIFNLINFQ